MKKTLPTLLAFFIVLGCEDRDVQRDSGVYFPTNTFQGYQFIALSDDNGKILLLQELSSITWLKEFGDHINVTLIRRFGNDWSFTAYAHVVSDTLSPAPHGASINVEGEHYLNIPDTGLEDVYTPSYGLSCGMMFESSTRVKILMCNPSDSLLVTVLPEGEQLPYYYFSTIHAGEETTLTDEDISSLPQMTKSMVAIKPFENASLYLSGVLPDGRNVFLSNKEFVGGRAYFPVPGKEVMGLFTKVKSEITVLPTVGANRIYQHIETSDRPVNEMERLDEIGMRFTRIEYPEIEFNSLGSFQAVELSLSGSSGPLNFSWTVYAPGQFETHLTLPIFEREHFDRMQLTNVVDARLQSIRYFTNFDFANYQEWYTQTIQQREEPTNKILSTKYFLP